MSSGAVWALDIREEETAVFVDASCTLSTFTHRPEEGFHNSYESRVLCPCQ